MIYDQHPWLHEPSHSNDFQSVPGKGGFWHYGANRTVDAIIVSEQSDGIYFCLIERLDDHLLAHPGGFINIDEDSRLAAIREAREETGLDISPYVPTLLYEGPVADYRATKEAWPHTFAYLFTVPEPVPVYAADDAVNATWYRSDALKKEWFHGSHFELTQRALTQLGYAHS